MPGWERPPAVVECMMVGLGADLEGNKRVRLCADDGLTAGNKVRARTANSVFDDIGEERSQNQRNSQTKDSTMVLVERSSSNAIVDDNQAQWNKGGIDNIEPNGNSFDFGVRERNI